MIKHVEPYNKDSQIKFKSSILKSSLCDSSDAEIIVKGTITIEAEAGGNPNNGSKKVVFKNCASFTDCISDEPDLTDAGTIAGFSAADNSVSFKFKQKTTGKAAANGRKDIEIIVSLKYLSNFWRTLEMPLLNCEINLVLTCVLPNDTKTTAFAITEAKLHFPVVTVLTQDNAKLLQQLKSGFKRTINWNKYQSKLQEQNQYLDYLIDPSFQRVNRLFILSFGNNGGRTSYTK